MHRFSDFNIRNESTAFTGDKIKINRIMNTEIVVHGYRVVDSKFGKGNEKCLHMQIEYKGEKYVVFTGSINLTEMLQKVAVDKFPFTTTIRKENERYEFT